MEWLTRSSLTDRRSVTPS